MRHINHFAGCARNLSLLGVVLLLGACGSGGGPDISGRADRGAQDLIDAATTPLEDLNIKQKDIPPLLVALEADPYAKPKKVTCKGIQQELSSLDDLLGPDYESGKIKVTPAVVTESKPAKADRDDNDLQAALPDTDTVVNNGENFAHDSIIGFIRSQLHLPFRSIIRLVTGADSHEKEVKQAYQAGQLRRAYLKGLAEDRFGKRCLMPPGVLEARATHAS